MFRRHVSAAMGRSALACVLAVAMGASAAEARIEGRARADFLRANYPKCLQAAERHPVARDLPSGIVTRICTCAANSAADRLTREDAAIVRYGNNAERQQVLRKASAYSDTGLRQCIRSQRQAG